MIWIEVLVVLVPILIGIGVYVFEILARSGGQDVHRGKFALIVSLLLAIFASLAIVRYVKIPEISSVIDSLPQQENKLRSEALTRAKDSKSELFQRVLNDRLLKQTELLTAGSQGQFELKPSELEEYGLDLFKYESNTTILATSYVEPDQWWKTPFGQKYLNENFEAVSKRGVTIERIYIFLNEAELKANKEELDVQKKNGIKIRYAYSYQIKNEIKDDIIVIGEKLSGLLVLKDRKMVKMIFDTDKNKITEARKTYEQIRIVATPY